MIQKRTANTDSSELPAARLFSLLVSIEQQPLRTPGLSAFSDYTSANSSLWPTTSWVCFWLAVVPRISRAMMLSRSRETHACVMLPLHVSLSESFLCQLHTICGRQRIEGASALLGESF